MNSRFYISNFSLLTLFFWTLLQIWIVGEIQGQLSGTWSRSIEASIHERKPAEALGKIKAGATQVKSVEDKFIIEIYKTAVFRIDGQLAEALHLRDSILKIPEHKWPVDARMKAYFYNLCGIFAASIPPQDMEEAILYFDRAIDLIYREKDVYTQLQLATHYDNKGKVLQGMRDYLQASIYIEKAHEIMNRLGDRNDPRLYSIKLSFASIKSHLGFLNEARSLFEQTLTYFANGREGFGHNIAVVHYNLGNLSFKERDYEEAMVHYQTARDLYAEMYGHADRLTLQAGSKAASCLIISGDIEQGMILHKHIREQMVLQEYVDTLDYADQLLELSADLISIDEFGLALPFITDCITILSPYLNKDFQASVIAITAYSYYTKLLIQLERLTDAKEANKIHQSLSLFCHGRDHYGLGYVRYFDGLIAAMKAEDELALLYFDQALEALRSHSDPIFYYDASTYLEICYQKGLLHYQMFNKQQDSSFLITSDSLTTLALNLAVDFFNSKGSYNSQGRIRGQVSEILELKMELSRRLRPAEKSSLFQIMEHAKSTLLMQYLEDKSVVNTETNLPPVLRQWSEVKTKRLFLEEEVKSGTHPAELKAEIRDSLMHLYAVFDSLKNIIQTAYPEYWEQFSQSQPSDMRSFMHTLKDDQTFIHFLTGISHIYIFKITNKKSSFYTLPLEQIDEQVAGYKSMLSNANSSIQDVKQISYSLYKGLLAPLGELSEQLIICPYGFLHGLPFETLITEPDTAVMDWRKLSYLLKDHQVSYAFSASMARKMQTTEARKGPLTIWAPHFVHDNLQSDHGPIDSLPNLFFNREEAHQLMQFKDFEPGMVPSSAMTKADFSRELSRSGIFHFASHAYADPRVPSNSFLALSNEGTHTRFKTHEMSGTYSPMQLVVLSACQTAAGPLQKGEGVASISRSFALAGAKSILSTLWQINDLSSVHLMENFYRLMSEGSTKDQALRQAKLSYINSCRDIDKAHPFYWSGFVLYGDSSTVELINPFPWKTMTYIIVFLIICFGIWYVYHRRSKGSGNLQR